MAALLFLCGLGLLVWERTAGPGTAAPDAAAARTADDALPADQLEILTRSGPRRFSIELAETPEQQAKGLMFRSKLADTAGMLFPHDQPGELTMWMRNTYIPLDMVFIREDGTVHRIAANTEPLSETVIPSRGAVSAVLEIAGGAAARLGIAPGDKVRHVLFKSPAVHDQVR